MSYRDGLEGKPCDRRPGKPAKLLEAMEISEGRSESLFARLIRLENTIQIRHIPGFITRGRAQGSVNRGNPVRAKGLCHRAAVSLTPEIRFEEFLDCAVIPVVEIDREARGNPLYFPAPVIEQVGVVDEHARQAARVPLGQQ